MDWTPAQKNLIRTYRGENRPSPENLTRIPAPDRKYKCHICHLILRGSDLIDGNCPVCGEASALKIMCPLDHAHCSHTVIESLAYCPICGHAICPECGTHDVSQMSRITGYVSSVEGWNKAKAQELMDRVRCDPMELEDEQAPVAEPQKPVAGTLVEAVPASPA
jgi:hypothetical protein